MANEKRLIDANGVIKKLEYEIKTQCNPVSYLDNGFDVFIKNVIPKLLRDVIVYLERQPTVDAVEVVHGHNAYDHDSAFECSVCGWSDRDTLTGDGKYNYCPNCGAKMDGEK